MSNLSESQDKENDKKEKENKDDKSSATIEDVKRIVAEAVESIKTTFNSDDDTSADDKSGDEDKSEGEEEKKEERKTRRTYASIEADARRMVEEQVKSVLGEIEHKKEHEEIKKKAPAQKPPIKVRRSTRFWLGKDYGNE